MVVSLALSGGAARGAFHLGVIAALHDKNIRIGAISGSSIGAVIAVGIASGVPPRHLLELFQSPAFRNIFLWHSFRAGWLRIDEQAAILKELCPIQRLEAMLIPTFISCVDLNSGALVCFDRGESIPLAIASSALFPLFRPITYEGYCLVDGGFMDNLPITPLRNYAYPIVSSDLFPLHVTQPKGFFALAKRSIFLSFKASSQAQKQHSTLYISEDALASVPLFGFSSLAQCFEWGYARAHAAILTMAS